MVSDQISQGTIRCDRCGKQTIREMMFSYDDHVACKSHLLEFRTVGSIEFTNKGRRDYLYSATRSELESLVNNPNVSDIVVRSFEWVDKPRVVSRPLQVSKAYNRKVRWVTLKK